MAADEAQERNQEAARVAAARAREKARELRVAFQGEATIRGSTSHADVEARVEVRQKAGSSPASSDAHALDGRPRELLVIATGLLILPLVLAAGASAVEVGHATDSLEGWTLQSATGWLVTVLALLAWASAGLAFALQRRAVAAFFVLAATLGVWITATALAEAPEGFSLFLYGSGFAAVLAFTAAIVVVIVWVVRVLRATSASRASVALDGTTSARLLWHEKFVAWLLLLCLPIVVAVHGYWLGHDARAAGSAAVALVAVVVGLVAFGALARAALRTGPAAANTRAVRTLGGAASVLIGVVMIGQGGPLAVWSATVLLPGVALLTLVAAQRFLSVATGATNPSP